MRNNTRHLDAGYLRAERYARRLLVTDIARYTIGGEQHDARVSAAIALRDAVTRDLDAAERRARHADDLDADFSTSQAWRDYLDADDAVKAALRARRDYLDDLDAELPDDLDALRRRRDLDAARHAMNAAQTAWHDALAAERAALDAYNDAHAAYRALDLSGALDDLANHLADRFQL